MDSLFTFGIFFNKYSFLVIYLHDEDDDDEVWHVVVCYLCICFIKQLSLLSVSNFLNLVCKFTEHFLSYLFKRDSEMSGSTMPSPLAGRRN